MFDTLTRRHAIKVLSTLSVDECSIAVGNIVGHDNVVAASRMNNAIVLFLSSVAKANEVVEKGLSVNGLFTPVLPLSTPARKVTISNVPPFITDEMLKKELGRYGKLISPIKKILIGTKSELVKHVVSFRRYVYVILNNPNMDLNLSLKCKVDDFDYTVFVSTDSMRCFGCGKTGHTARTCPIKGTSNVKPNESRLTNCDSRADKPNAEVQTTTAAGEGPAGPTPSAEVREKHDGAQAQSEIPTVSGDIFTESFEKLSSEVFFQNCTEDSRAEAQASTAVRAGSVGPAPSAVEGEQNHDEAEGQGNIDKESHESKGTTCFESEEVNMQVDHGASLVEFKKPIKRKMSLEIKSAKKSGNEPVATDMDEPAYESDCSDSGTSICSQGSAPLLVPIQWSIGYGVSEIKLFLKITKNMKNVQVVDYFPDLENFTKVTRCFMRERKFTQKEVYRLKKFLTKVNPILTNNDDMA